MELDCTVSGDVHTIINSSVGYRLETSKAFSPPNPGIPAVLFFVLTLNERFNLSHIEIVRIDNEVFCLSVS